MCDERGMSVNAPPPAMPIRDARIERGEASICPSAAMLLDLGRRVERQPHVVDARPLDAWADLTDRSGIGAPENGILAGETPTLVRALAHESGVFRPPRAV